MPVIVIRSRRVLANRRTAFVRVTSTHEYMRPRQPMELQALDEGP